MTPTVARKKQRHVEDQIQAAVIQHLELRGVPGLVYWHTPNSSKLGGKRTQRGLPLAAIRLKKLGLRAGVSDLLLFHQGRLHALELKAPGGKPSKEQISFLAAIRAAGGLAECAVGMTDATVVLHHWGLLRSAKSQCEAVAEPDEIEFNVA